MSREFPGLREVHKTPGRGNHGRGRLYTCALKDRGLSPCGDSCDCRTGVFWKRALRAGEQAGAGCERTLRVF